MTATDAPAGYEAITVQTADGRTLYWPPGDVGRLAPAAVCAVASRIVRLREKLALFSPEDQAMLRPFLLPLPFEEKLLSGKIEKVHDAILQIALEELSR